MERDSYGKVAFINAPYYNTGSVTPIKTDKEKDKKLDKAMQKLSDSLDRSFKKFKMDEYFDKLAEQDWEDFC